MGCASWKHLLVIAITSLSTYLSGQITDCVGAQIICSDGPITFRPNGPGINDFLNPNNDPGCLSDFEKESAWYYFEFREDMPPNSLLELTISPFLRPGEQNPDYDFAIFGPDLKCDSLGTPTRCSFAYDLCDFCPETGLGRGATDTSEMARNTDGFVAPLEVQPGEGFYLLLDNFKGDATGFTLTWGGSAAPYLNCLANPTCRNRTVDAGDDMQFCQNPAPFKLNASVKNVSNRVKYEWLGTPQALSFLNNTTVLQPTVTIPANFSGTLDYILSITDGDCVTADAITVNIIPVTPAQLRADTLICQGETSTISLTNIYQTYTWSDGTTNPTITVSTGGTYSVTVSNGGTCFSTDEIFINYRDLPRPVIDGGGKICSGESLTIRTNTPFSTYFWSNGRSAPTTTIDRGGNYSVTVTDEFGCRGTGALAVAEFPKPTPEIIGTTAFCEGQNTTLATKSPYPTYRWSSGETTPTIAKDTSGLFFVTVTDVNGCSGIDSATIVQNSLPTLAITGKPVFCTNSTTQLNATTNATQLTWSNGATTPTISVATAGSYSVTAINAQGCQKSDTIAIRQQPVPQPFITDSITICPENSATLETQSIFATYRWSTGATTPSIKVSQAGNYNVEVTDSVGCVGNATLTVDVFPVIPAPNITGVQNFCPANGTTLTANGNYVGYRWSNGDTTASIQVFTTGAYTVTVRDANNCMSQDTINVQAFAVNAPVSDTIPFCSGTSATINPGGNYLNYRWSNGSTQPNIQVSTAGIYSVTVTDVNNCQSSATYTTRENVLPPFPIQGIKQFCSGDSSQLSAPTGFQSYKWSTNATTESITVQTGGNYNVTVTDINGCTATSSATVTALPLPTPRIGGIATLCDNEQGTLSVSPNFVQYRWSTGSQQPTLTVNQGGIYLVTVTDANNCQGTASIEIPTFPNPTVAITADTLICQGTNTIITATKGFPSYQWSDGSTRDSITANAGTYGVTITDQNGCKGSDEVIISQVNAPVANAGPNYTLDCNTKSVSLGTSPNGSSAYRYQWEGPAINTSNKNIPQPLVNQAGEYKLILTDTVSGCQSAVATVQVTDLTYTPRIALQLKDTLDCNTASVTISALGSPRGNGISYHWYDVRREAIANARDTSLNISRDGFYYFEIKDANTGCSAIDSIQVRADYDPAFVDAGTGDTLDCNTSIVTLQGKTSSTADYILFRWATSDGTSISNQLTPEVAQPGWYILTVTNAKNGCSNRDSVEIKLDRTPPMVSAGTDQTLDCNMSMVSLQGKGDSTAIYYSWSANNNFVFDDPNQLSQTVRQPGIYVLEARNLQNGCIAKDSVIVLDDSDYPTKLDLKVVDPTCFGAKNGQIQILNITGGQGPYFYSLNGSPMESVAQFDSLPAGNYIIKVEDVAGCAYETEVTLKDGIPLEVSLGKDTTIRFGARITLEASVTIPTQNIIDLKWSKNAIEDCYDGCWLQPVAPKKDTIYTVTVTDKNGCQSTDDILVKVESSRGVFIPNAFSPNGDGYNDVFVIYAGREVTGVKNLLIMNRWGNQVFEAGDFRPNDPTRGWDGRVLTGKDVNSNVFVYKADIQFIDGEVLTFYGDITIIR